MTPDERIAELEMQNAAHRMVNQNLIDLDVIRDAQVTELRAELSLLREQRSAITKFLKARTFGLARDDSLLEWDGGKLFSFVSTDESAIWADFLKGDE